MPSLLTVHASPRDELSISRKLGKRYVHYWLGAHPNGTVVERDVTHPAVPYMNLDYIQGVYAPPELTRTPEMRAAIALSETLIAELVAADQVLICTPMYNFSVPATLKSWIDYIVRPDFTFKKEPGWPGMLPDKPTRVIIASRDVYEPGSDDDQATPVIRRAFAFMGIRDVTSLIAGGSLGVNRHQVSVEDHVARFETAIASLVP